MVGPVRPKAKSRKESKDSDDDFDDILMSYATDAMSFYNKGKGTKYELVEPGCITSVLLLTGFFYHIDFIAKKADVADAPEEFFSVELTATNKDVFVELCKCMGPKNLISGEKINGCSFCNMYDNVLHPKDGGFTAGDFMDFEEWKKNYNSPPAC
ncbi:hypothetical protein MKW98_012316 [Papaver atlanticum]|uniref:DUF3615 domain-containing protein n=1 Tax=Papaver atlanticum TaxID=357466 RepID=A0AAD4XQ60_9MAGN|nr:hypothetical protein MKW98_012316 [Papaver atlanticum]